MSNSPRCWDERLPLTCFRSGKAASYREMPSLKATFLFLITAALYLPSLAQAPGANNAAAKTAPNKAAVTTAKPTTVTASKTAAKAAPAAKAAQGPRAKAKKTAGKKGPEPQPQVQLPPPPPTPAQLPPNPARVTMRNGLLTIDANNSTLADVLTGVRRETKAAIDLPAGVSGERVVANLGPGTPQSVLTALLNGSRFDYIILGSEDQPDAVQRVILRAKSGPEPAPGGPVVAQRGPNPGGVNVQPAQPDDGDDQGAPAEEIPDESNPQAQQQEIDNEQQQGQPGQQQQQQGQPGQQQQPQQPGVKTPEQLLEELRQMQQQQQEQQQQQQPQQGPQPPYQQQQPQQPSPDEQ
jgi:hypothetical protein